MEIIFRHMEGDLCILNARTIGLPNESLGDLILIRHVQETTCIGDNITAKPEPDDNYTDLMYSIDELQPLSKAINTQEELEMYKMLYPLFADRIQEIYDECN